jgi:hypothetical protein
VNRGAHRLFGLHTYEKSFTEYEALRSHRSKGRETLIAELSLEDYFQTYTLYCLARIFEYAEIQTSRGQEVLSLYPIAIIFV